MEINSSDQRFHGWLAPHRTRSSRSDPMTLEWEEEGFLHAVMAPAGESVLYIAVLVIRTRTKYHSIITVMNIFYFNRLIF